MKDSLAHVEILRDYDEARTSARLNRIGSANRASFGGTQEVNRRLAAAQAGNDLLVKVGVGLKTWPHPCGATVPPRAASIFA